MSTMQRLALMMRPGSCQFLAALGALSIVSCSGMRETARSPVYTREILLTSEAGDKLANMENVPFQAGAAFQSAFARSRKMMLEGLPTGV